MQHRLREILAAKQDEVAQLKQTMLRKRGDHRPPLRDFKAALSLPQQINLVAEIKFASPSAGLIRLKSDPATIARIFEKAGAAAISLLTDKQFFQGDLEQLPRLKRAVSLPVLRKDFIIDAVQVWEAFLYGADAILLIARILSHAKLAELTALCRDLGMAPLTEVHDREDLQKAIECGAEIVGINNRDLDSFKVDLRTTFALAPLVPDNCVIVSESGIENEGDILALKGIGVHSVLVGSALMRSNDLIQKTGELVNAGKMHDG